MIKFVTLVWRSQANTFQAALSKEAFLSEPVQGRAAGPYRDNFFPLFLCLQLLYLIRITYKKFTVLAYADSKESIPRVLHSYFLLQEAKQLLLIDLTELMKQINHWNKQCLKIDPSVNYFITR